MPTNPNPSPESYALSEVQIAERARSAAFEILSVYNVEVPRGVTAPRNGISRTLAIIIEQNMKGIHR